MLPASKSKLITILAHVLMWVLFGIAIFFYHPLFSGVDIPAQAWIKQGITLSLLVIAFYVNTAILVPRLLLKNKAVYYLLAAMVLVSFVVIINTRAEQSLPDPYPQFNRSAAVIRTPGLPRPEPRRRIDRSTIIITVLVLGIGTSITAIQKWQTDRQQRNEQEKASITSELSFLKAQLSPHFFFNTLNNIYALTASDPDLAGKAIHQLSRMMRYLLYETASGETMLSKEIIFMNDYIGLMQLRLTDSVKVSFETSPRLEDMPVAPLLFLPFVENAFKHGAGTEQPCYIDICISQEDKMVHFNVKNSIMKDKSVSLETHTGIGLANTRRRLNLLYPGKHTLRVHERNAENEYHVYLQLNLA